MFRVSYWLEDFITQIANKKEREESITLSTIFRLRPWRKVIF